MKVAQNDETNQDTQPVCPPRVPSIVNLQHFTSGTSARKRETPGTLSRMFPPFVGITSYHVRAYLAPRFASLCFVMLCLLRIYCFSPLSFSARLRDRHCCCPVRLRSWRPILLARATTQAPHDHQIAYSSLYCLHESSVACYCFPISYPNA